MCVVSMVMDHYGDKWKPFLPPPRSPFDSISPIVPPITPLPSPITSEEIKEFRELLDRAREYDRKHNQPDCGMDEKRTFFKQLGDYLGVDFRFVEESHENI